MSASTFLHNIVGGTSPMSSQPSPSRALEDNGYSSAGTSWDGDYMPPSFAFQAAALIFVLLVSVVVVFGMVQNRREKAFSSCGEIPCGGFDFESEEAGERASYLEKSIWQSEALDARYNLQTLALALFQGSLSMVILGGSQMNFRLTSIVVLAVVGVWTFFFGVVLTLWMSKGANVAEHWIDEEKDAAEETAGAEAEGEGDGGSRPTPPPRSEEESHLRALTYEAKQRRFMLKFVRHYVAFSLVRPMTNPDRLVARDIYQDIGRSASRTFLLGAGQIVMLSMYVWSIVDDGRPDFTDGSAYKFYCLGIFVQVAYIAGQDMLYRSTYNHFAFWGTVLRAARKGRSYEWTPPEYLLYHRPRMAITGSVRGYSGLGACVRLRNSPFLWFRFLLSTTVNVGGLGAVTLLLPMQLATNPDPLRFVMSAVGAYYILAIDDYGSPVTYTLVSEVSNGRGAGGSDQRISARNRNEDDVETGTQSNVAMDSYYSMS